MEKEEFQKEIERLKGEIEQLERKNAELSKALRNAKDPDPIQKPSLKRFVNLIHGTCLNVRRVKRGIEVYINEKIRLFRSIKEAWEFFIQDDWSWGELFPEIPPKAPKGCCKYCQKPIQWSKDWDNELWQFINFMPINPDGSRHNCQERKRKLFFKREEVVLI